MNSQDTQKRDYSDHGETPTEKKLDEFYNLVDGIKVAMFTSRRPDGYLVTRPMATQKRTAGGDLWFVTNVNSFKLDELRFDPHVNIGYYKGMNGEWVSVSGLATVSQDRNKIRELYSQDWKAWFGDEGDGIHTGDENDPRIALIFVDAHSVSYLKNEISMPRFIWQVAKGSVTGERPKPGAVKQLDAGELHRADQKEQFKTAA